MVKNSNNFEKSRSLTRAVLVNKISITVLFCLLIAFFYSNRMFLTGASEGEVLFYYDVPQASFFINTVKTGSFPLWNPHKACGLPFFEVSFMGPYYPAVFLYFLFPIEKAVNYGFLVHILMSAIFMYLLCKELKFGRAISFFCSISWIFSSIFQQFSESGYLAQTVSASYLPGLIYFFIKTIRAKYPENIIFCSLTALLFSLTITGGNPHYAAIIIYSFLFFSVLSLRNMKNVKYLFVIFLVGLMLSIVYWGPILTQLDSSIFKPLKYNGYHLRQLRNFLFPFQIRRGFVGRLVFFLGILGIFFKGSFSKNFRLLLLGSFILMFSQAKFMGIPLINYVPFAKKDNYVWLWHTGFIFSLVIFSGVSLDRLRLWLHNKKKTLFVILSICIGLQIIDLYNFNSRFYPTGFKYKFEEYFPTCPFVDFFKKDASLFRISNEPGQLEHFRLNQGMLEGISCFQSKIKGINSRRFTGEDRMLRCLFTAPLQKMQNICNIKYIITPRRLNISDFTKIFEIEDRVKYGRKKQKIYLYQNRAYYPRAFLIENISEAGVKATLIDNYKEPLLKLSPTAKTLNLLSNYKRVDIKWLPNRYMISFDSKYDNFLFLSEMYAKGWEASVDGKPAKIYTPFYFFMGVFCPPGKHLVTFQFRPLYFYIFLIISISTFLTLMSINSYLIFKMKRYRTKKDSSNIIC